MNKKGSPEDNNEEEEDEGREEDESEALKRELKEEMARAKDYLNRLKYLQADFENYKKRVKKEMNETTRYANLRIIQNLLPILDELESAVQASKGEGGKEALQEGVEMTLNNLHKILKKEGLSIIEAVGKQFDPKKHEAIERIETEEENGMIIEETRKGYKLKDTILRPSEVKVAVNTSQEGEE